MFRRVAARWTSFVLTPTALAVDKKQFIVREDRMNKALKRWETIKNMTNTERDDLKQHDIDELITTLVRYHDLDAVSQVLRFAREQMGLTLRPFHYASLMRMFCFSRDKVNLDQLLEVVATRDQFNPETLACTIAAVHHLGSRDRFPRMLDIIGEVLEWNPALLATEETEGTMAGVKHSPVLSSLLAAGACSDIGVVFVYCVAFWIRALGCELVAWDYANMMTALARDTELFPSLRQKLSFVPGVPQGCLTFEALSARVMVGGKTRANTPQLAQILPSLLHTMEKSLLLAGVATSQTIQVGKYVNNSATRLDTVLDLVLAEAHAQAARRGGVLPGTEDGNPCALHHYLVLLHQALRNPVSAALQVSKVHEWCQAAAAAPAEDDTTKPASPHVAFLVDASESFRMVPKSVLEKSAVPFSDLMDIVKPTAVAGDVSFCTAHGLAMVRTQAEAQDALARLIAATRPAMSMSSSRVPYWVKVATKGYLHLCCRFTPRNVKMGAESLKERQKWFRFVEARDTALTLYGGGDVAKAKAAEILKAGGIEHLRTPETIAKDLHDFATLLGQTDGDGNLVLAPEGARDTLPNLRLPSDPVPRHLWDADIPNPYPHVQMTVTAAPPLDGAAPLQDPFPALWDYLTSSESKWHYACQETTMLLVKCFLYRLDWVSAADVIQRSIARIPFSFAMDSELQVIFNDIGDPAGAMCFKLATGIYDGAFAVQNKVPNVKASRRGGQGSTRA